MFEMTPPVSHLLTVIVSSVLLAVVGGYCNARASEVRQEKFAMAQKTAETSRSHLPQVSLDTRIEVKESKLVVRYAVHNRNGQDIYLYNRLVRMAPDGSGTVDPNLAYVTFSKGPAATISKSVQAVPPWLQVTQHEVPYLTQLRAGQRLEEELSLELPLKEHHPYFPLVRTAQPQGGADETVATKTRTVRFELGYIVKQAGYREVAFTEGGETLYLLQGQFEPVREQQILRSTEVFLSVPAIVPKDTL